MKNKPKTGDLRLIPSGTWFWSIALQEMISLQKDAIVKIEHTVFNSDDYFYGYLQLILFEHTIPGITEKAHGDIGIVFSKTKPYKLPKNNLNFDLQLRIK